ncbi:MAG: T9SS type A sorting domain-containing protein [Bacteroidales bacterium]|nr:T9SS type A sorting domain-containing protein [Bacteroidales bacterium]
MNNLKTILVSAVVLFLTASMAMTQYVYNYQAVYPHNYGNFTTKNYTLAKEFKNQGYLMAAHTRLPSGVTALSGIKLDNNFNLSFNRAYQIPNVKRSSIISHDVIGTSDGGYAVCGMLYDGKMHNAFIAKFDGKFGFQWIRKYPGISNLYSIIEIQTKAKIKQKYIAVGEQVFKGYGSAVLLCVNVSGFPIWERRPASPGKSDRLQFRDVIQLKNSISPVNYLGFAAVGNSRTQPGNNNDVLLSHFDVNGNVNYTQVYGIPNNEKVTYLEQGMGIAEGVKSDLIITGRTQCRYTKEPKRLWDDVLLFSVKSYNGGINWIKRYDMAKSSNRMETGQAVTLRKDEIYVSGYYHGYVFNPDGSYDAFVFKTKVDGSPIQNRIFGDKNYDLAFTVMNNVKYDGIIAAGFSNSFLNTKGYSPYVIETYDKTKKRCHDLITKLPTYKMEMKQWKLKHFKLETKIEKLELWPAKVPVHHKVICPKIPIPIPVPKSAEIEEIATDGVQIYPTIANSHLNVKGVDAGMQYTIFNVSGKLISNGILENSHINIEDLAKGIYIIKMNNQAVKFIKSH